MNYVAIMQSPTIKAGMRDLRQQTEYARQAWPVQSYDGGTVEVINGTGVCLRER